ncbi:MAG TPA: CsbD family protein [Terriglobales bacterium]|nr:CsbD family protein [Terriglobales bacterium]
MKSSTKDKTEGKFHEVQGKIKEKFGKVMKNPELEAEGRHEKKAGKIQKWIGHAEKAVGQ